MSAIWFEKTNVDKLPSVEIETELSIDRFSRLGECVLPGSEPVKARAAFDRRDNGIVLMTCHICGSLQVECQRCLEPMRLSIENDLKLALLASEEDEELVPADFEPLILPDGGLRLADLIEDEVLLDLPLVARHSDGPCRTSITGPGIPQRKASETTKPFVDLAKLMRGEQ